MKRSILNVAFLALFLIFTGFSLFAADPITLETVIAPGPNQMDEPIAKTFSIEQATSFLDSASLSWQKTRKCMTCHTNYAYLYARPGLSSEAPAHKTVREFAEKLVTDRWEETGPRWDAEVVATAAALAFNDAATTGSLHPVTRKALDRMWTVQQEDGGWSWLKCGWPPMESDDHYGVTLAAIAVGVAPDDYISTTAASRDSLNYGSTLITILHQLCTTVPCCFGLRVRLMDSLLISRRKQQLKICSRYNKLMEVGDWQHWATGNGAMGKEQDLKSSDGYGTGFVIYVLRSAGVEATSSEIQQGISWLKANQRESGRWFTRSLNKDSKHYITHAGTAMAILALSACDELRSSESD